MAAEGSLPQKLNLKNNFRKIDIEGLEVKEIM